MEGRGIMSPKRSRFSPKMTKKGTPQPAKPAKNKHPRNVTGSKIEVTPIPNPTPPRAATNPSPNHSKTQSRSEPSSPIPPPTPTPTTRSQPTTPSSSNTNVVRQGGLSFDNPSVSKSFHSPKDYHKSSPGSWLGLQKDVNTSPDPSSPASSHTASDLSDRLLQRLSFDDVADILQGKSIYDIMGSNKKEETSQSIDGLRVLQIYKEIASHRQENLFVEPYFRKLNALWDELSFYITDLAQCSSGGAIQNVSELTERQKVVQFLVGLNDSYATICGQILVKRPFPTVEEAYSEIIGEEKRRELVAALETVAAKVIQSNWLLKNQNSRSNNNRGIDQEVDNANLGSPM
ncbi:proline-rich receptor-like protein kinase PERK2 isoform X2 [Benincasa hispida]|uniref:proline-rich receptor-like protein kinase PERK2 isoform X2 n=1 Tax=Benincasa hispida TaxID=102211 RepID=UPI00190244CE|nr:proline-rich receptor-like protein kinase PERK2 isoform X2 [Benincasa hispida]